MAAMAAPAAPAGRNCWIALWIMESARPPWWRRERTTISAPMSATLTTATAIHPAKNASGISNGLPRKKLWIAATISARTPVAASAAGPKPLKVVLAAI